MATVTGVQEIAIDQGEGEMLASATANVLAQFDITPDPKTQALVGLILAAGAVYAPRVIVYKARKAQERAEKQAGVAGVYDANGTPQGTTGFSEAQ